MRKVFDLIQTAKSKASGHVRARQPRIILTATPNHQRRAQAEQGANLEAIKEGCLSKSCTVEVKGSEDATRRIRDRTADSEHAEREPFPASITPFKSKC